MNSDLDQNCQGSLSYLQMNYHIELCNNKNPWKDKIQMSFQIFFLRYVCVVLTSLAVIFLVLGKYVLSNSAS